MKIRILETRIEFIDRKFIKPLQVSRGKIESIKELQVGVVVEVNNISAEGFGSVLLSDLWAWPDARLSHQYKTEKMMSYAKDIQNSLWQRCGDNSSHPIVLGINLHHSLEKEASDLPILARSICASPFDAALHDATGRALNISAFSLYRDDFRDPLVDEHFPGEGAFKAIRNVLRDKPRSTLTAWHLVGFHDDLLTVKKEWKENRGYSAFKIKTLARDPKSDADRIAEVFDILSGQNPEKIALSLDSNEANKDSDSVEELLTILKQKHPAAFNAVQYLEQPTDRDIKKFSFDWSKVARLKPVFLDEGLTSMESLTEALQNGWGGIAIKTCKGHSFSLLCAAWAQRNNLLISIQDLTNTGYAFMHSALLAGHLPSVNGVELNSPQYLPEANKSWEYLYPELFSPKDGLHHLPDGKIYGLGFSNDPKINSSS